MVRKVEVAAMPAYVSHVNAGKGWNWAEGDDTLGIEYTNDPRALREEVEDGSVVVKNTILDVLRGVICTWRVVCGERGRGMESCWGWSVGDIDVEVGAVGSGGC